MQHSPDWQAGDVGQDVTVEGRGQTGVESSWAAWATMADALMAADRTARRNGHNSAAHIAAMEHYERAWAAYQRAAGAATARAVRSAGYGERRGEGR